MTVLQRIAREPARALAVVLAVLSLIVLFGVPIADEQVGGIGLVLSAALELIRWLSVPAREVVAQQLPDGTLLAGAAATEQTGAQLAVTSGEPDSALVAPIVTVPAVSLPLYPEGPLDPA